MAVNIIIIVPKICNIVSDKIKFLRNVFKKIQFYKRLRLKNSTLH